MYNSVLRYRRETAGLYCIDPKANAAEPRSSRPSMLDTLQWHFDATERTIQERSREYGTAVDDDQAIFGRADDGGAVDNKALQAELKRHLADLANSLLAMFEERVAFLRWLVSFGSYSCIGGANRHFKVLARALSFELCKNVTLLLGRG
jgi:nuclear pore complex protein Nup133